MTNSEIAVEESLKEVRAYLANGLNRTNLEKAKTALIGLASQQDMWSSENYPDPAEDEPQARYLVAQDDSEGLTLYLNVMRPGKKVPPHDHTTWACVAAASGIEYNSVFERVDDGSESGIAELKKVREVKVEPGMGIALMPEDIHQIEIRGEDVIRHLHMYGRPLETLSDRTIYDLKAGTCRKMDIGVKTRR